MQGKPEDKKRNQVNTRMGEDQYLNIAVQLVVNCKYCAKQSGKYHLCIALIPEMNKAEH
jgi:hypothetical protein